MYNLCKESNYLEPQIEPANEIPRGTSFFGDKITLPLSRVHKMFGAPIPPVSKTYYQWALKINDIPFLLYDYKLDEVPHLLDYVDWHIGTDSEEHSKFIAEELKKLFE